LEYKHANLSGIAHEWWHSIDRALVYSVNGGRVMARNYTDLGYATKVEDGDWFGRKETLEAARAFDVYIIKKFEEAGIKIEGVTHHFRAQTLLQRKWQLLPLHLIISLRFSKRKKERIRAHPFFTTYVRK
jgi:hypothetical protein